MSGRTKSNDAGFDPPDGARVLVRWGLDLLPGSLVERYASGSGARMVVRLDPQGPGEGELQTVTVPASEVYPAEDVDDHDPPGTWIPHAKYEREFTQALSRILRRMKWADVTKLEHRSDEGLDLFANTNRGRLLVEVKYSNRDEFTEKRANEAARQMEKLSAALKFLVSNAHFSDLTARNLTASHVIPITWRSPEDDPLLEAAISTALERAGVAVEPGTGSPRGRGGSPSHMPPARSSEERASKAGRPRHVARGDIETYYEDGQWKNRTEGNWRASTVHKTKAEAEAAGRRMAAQRDVEHVIKKKDGTTGEKGSHYRSRDSRQA
ncbi:DUF2188 domain-containing protein [Micromonospora aurantiaca (nom. illeg.)]|uniref:DUF2188 domain-containing protein n=1 Tax=Micromonospora aurantiaca (nom. illeg.) TaxID=47850 RepID=UPI00162275C3